MDYFVLSNAGRVRKTNQDYHTSFISNNYSLFVVADGMGGHNGGEVASKVACEKIVEWFRGKASNFNEEFAVEYLVHSMQFANNAILELSMHSEELRGMGTTAVVVLCTRKNVYFAHVGDSRAYIVKDNALNRVTRDHSFVEELVESGRIKAEEASDHKHKNILTRAVGTSKDLKIDVSNFPLDNFYILVCTDGLTNMVSEKDILDIVSRYGSVEEKVTTLIEMANNNGGIDNITLLMIDKLSK